jgi:hypothetical protein
VWKGTVPGHREAVIKLQELAKQTENEVRLVHLTTQAVIAAMNTR